MNKSVFEKLAEKIIHTRNIEKKLALLAKLQHSLNAGSAMDITLILRDKLRDWLAGQAVSHYKANPKLYPNEVTILVDEMKRLQGKSAGYTARADDAKKLRRIFDFNTISEAVDEENLKAYYDSADKALAENPRLSKAGYRKLYEMTMLEIIAAFTEALSISPTLPQPQAFNTYLLMTMEDLALAGYDLGFLHFNGVMYEILSPENLCIETDVEIMSRKLAAVRNALWTTSNEVYEAFMREVTDMITPAHISALITAIGGKGCLPAETRFRVDHLDEIQGAILTAPIERSAPPGMTPRAGRESALEMLNALCVHDDVIFLQNDYEELLNCAAACPRYVDELQQQAFIRLSEHIISELLGLQSKKPSDEIRCLAMLQHMMISTLPNRVVVYL